MSLVKFGYRFVYGVIDHVRLLFATEIQTRPLNSLSHTRFAIVNEPYHVHPRCKRRAETIRHG